MNLAQIEGEDLAAGRKQLRCAKTIEDTTRHNASVVLVADSVTWFSFNAYAVENRRGRFE